jgi:peroxiredoxin
MARKLNAGTRFPGTTLPAVGGDSIRLPDGISTPYQIVLFYRGHW